MPTDEGGITRQGGECAAGIFPLKGFFNSPALVVFDLHQSEEFLPDRSRLILIGLN